MNPCTEPQQTNFVDCGVFVSQYVRYRCAQHALDFSEDDMTALRLNMTYEIRKTASDFVITKRLLYAK